MMKKYYRRSHMKLASTYGSSRMSYRPRGQKKLLEKWRGPIMITEVHQQGRFYRLSTGRAAHYENLKPHVPSPEDWCIPQDMEGLEYLLVEPACE